MSEDRQELKQKILDLTRIAIAEIIGTGLLVLVGCMGCMSSLAGVPIPLEQICWTFGVIVMCVIQGFAHISGGHVNPTVTITAVILGHIHYLKFPLYLISQCIGGIIGFALLKAVTPSRFFLAREPDGPGICSTVPNPNIHVLQALGVEMIISFVLALVCCSVWDHRNLNKHDSLSIKFGLTITGLAMAGAHYTGASMNPARSLAPALINNDWRGHWIYWVGPLGGAALCAAIYRFLFAIPKPEEA